MMQLQKDDDEFDDATKSSPFKGRLLTMAGYFDIWHPPSGVSIIKDKSFYFNSVAAL